jgi:hypothetical protein
MQLAELEHRRCLKNPDPNRCACKTKAGDRRRPVLLSRQSEQGIGTGPDRWSKRRPVGTETSDEFPAAITTIELGDLGARLIADILAGRINPRMPAGLVPLMNLQLRAVETADLETRLKKLEHQENAQPRTKPALNRDRLAARRAGT